MEKKHKRPHPGRPQIDLDQDQFEGLCGIMATLDEIAAWFKVHKDTVRKWCKRTYGTGFEETWKMFSGAGLASLRRAQFNSALKGDTRMQIWLGKQFLGQKEPRGELDLNTDVKYIVEYVEATEDDLALPEPEEVTDDE